MIEELPYPDRPLLVLPERPPRRMPTLPKLARQLGIYEQPPFCWKCRQSWEDWGSWEEATGYLDRAHIIDRFAGGLDGSQNLRPLCHQCHSWQPVFEPGDEVAALEWFDRHELPFMDRLEQLMREEGLT